MAISRGMMRSKLIPRMHGHIMRWIDKNHFIVLVKGVEILAHKEYWEETP